MTMFDGVEPLSKYEAGDLTPEVMARIISSKAEAYELELDAVAGGLLYDSRYMNQEEVLDLRDVHGQGGRSHANNGSFGLARKQMLVIHACRLRKHESKWDTGEVPINISRRKAKRIAAAKLREQGGG